MPNKKSLGKLYFYFLISAGVIFLLEKVSYPGIPPIDNNIMSNFIYNFQVFVGNVEVKKMLLTVLILVTLYVLMETLVFLRQYAGYLYFKYKKNNVIEE